MALKEEVKEVEAEEAGGEVSRVERVEPAEELETGRKAELGGGGGGGGGGGAGGGTDMLAALPGMEEEEEEREVSWEVVKGTEGATAVLNAFDTVSAVTEVPICIGLLLLLPALETDDGREVDWKEGRAGLGEAVTSCPPLGGTGELETTTLFGDVLVASPRGLGVSVELTEKGRPTSTMSADTVEAGLPIALTLGGLEETLVGLGLGCT